MVDRRARRAGSPPEQGMRRRRSGSHAATALLVCCAALAWVLPGQPAARAGAIRGTVSAGRPGSASPARPEENAVIYIERIPGKTFAPPERHAVMDQKNLTFIPRILPILAGTTVDYLNSDDVLHNVFSEDSCNGSFNLGTWSTGHAKSYRFDHPGCRALMLCNVHPEMAAYVLVLETPYHGVSDKRGIYTIPDVPPGRYTLKIWHERLRGDSADVVVPPAGEPVTVNFKLKE